MSLSFILFLFYNSELLKLCCWLKERLSAIEFADDVNMLLYRRITETNCKNLEQTHERCIKWARQHEMRFALQKYELIHFIRAHMKFNMQISIHLQNTEKTSTKNVQVLEIWLNCKLNWKAHLNHILKKMMTQTEVLIQLTASIWEANFLKSRQIYFSVIQSVMTYEVMIWHSLQAQSKIKRKKITRKLKMIQNKCLCTIAETYQVIFISFLKMKTHISLINLYLNKYCATYKNCKQRLKIKEIIINAQKIIQLRLKNKWNHFWKMIKTSKQLHMKWAQDWQAQLILISLSKCQSNLFKIKDKALTQQMWKKRW